jgi:hypothetical protein
VKVAVFDALAAPMLTVPKSTLGNGLTDFTLKLSVTDLAAAYVTPSPGCAAVILQVPTANSNAEDPDTVQIVGVVVLN